MLTRSPTSRYVKRIKSLQKMGMLAEIDEIIADVRQARRWRLSIGGVTIGVSGSWRRAALGLNVSMPGAVPLPYPAPDQMR